MLFSNFREVPAEILEASRMDGVSIWQELIIVLAPMALPGIASTFFLIFTLAWNESFWTLNLTTTQAAPLTTFIAAFSSPQGLFWARLTAASMLSIIPVLLIGWLCQRQLVRGLTFGAVK
jgi:sorbitol/mannitol transport system permease protein